MRIVYLLVIGSLLLASSPMMAMCCWWVRDENQQVDHELDANPILQKMIPAPNGSERFYQYDPSSSRWKLSQIISVDSKGQYCCRIYVRINGQVQVREKDGGLLETITTAAYDKLDLKDNGTFVTGSGQ